MRKRNGLAQAPCRSKRKYRRFPLRYPVDVKFHIGDSVSEVGAVSKNVSIGGLLLETASPIPQECPVKFIMTIHGGPVIRPIQLVGEGIVLRVESYGSGAGFGIAVKCDRPMSQLAHYLPAS
jgi:PilZ domain